jgi:hypothetical protein
MPRRPLFWLIPCLLFTATACGSRGSVALSALVEDPEVEVERSGVGSDVQGGFRLKLSLGDYAEDSTSVSIGTFSLQRDGADVLSPLSLGGQQFPVTIGVGESKSYELTFLQSPELEIADALCEGDLELFGSFTDSLNDDRPTTVRSAAFEPTCP